MEITVEEVSKPSHYSKLYPDEKGMKRTIKES
jgi:hypothetical protein